MKYFRGSGLQAVFGICEEEVRQTFERTIKFEINVCACENYTFAWDNFVAITRYYFFSLNFTA